MNGLYLALIGLLFLLTSDKTLNITQLMLLLALLSSGSCFKAEETAEQATSV